MTRKEIRKVQRMGRRRFVKTATLLGVSSSALAGLTQTVFAENVSDPNKEVLRLRGWKHTNQDEIEKGAVPEREPVYYTIPFEIWLRTEGTRVASNQLSRKFSDPRVETSISNDTGKPSGLHVLVQFQVDASDDENDTSNVEKFEEIKSKTPSSMDVIVEYAGKSYKVEDIPVEVEMIEYEQLSEVCGPGQYFVDTYRPVPAGCEAGRNVDSNSYAFSLSSPARDSNANSYIFTAGHAASSVDEPIYQNSNSSFNLIGYVDDIAGTSRFDWADAAIVQFNNNDNAEWDIANDGGGYAGWPIVGVLAKDKLIDMAANNEYLYKQGRSSGRDYGQAGSYNERAYQCDRFWMKTGSWGGDSGGIFFDLDAFDNAWAGALLVGGTDNDSDGCNDHSVGECFWELETGGFGVTI